MTSAQPRAVLSILASIGLAAGCAPSNTPHELGAAPMVTADDIERSSGQPIELVLQAKVPSLQINRAADGSLALEIRGPSSFYGTSAPLFVIDGVPMQPGPGGALLGVNPHDIESIKVLKNPADIGIYGVRGGNGVVVITTKRPGRI
jgi:TonB-dependent SusC/RagA subfamily outer membrane receptor